MRKFSHTLHFPIFVLKQKFIHIKKKNAYNFLTGKCNTKEKSWIAKIFRRNCDRKQVENM